MLLTENFIFDKLCKLHVISEWRLECNLNVNKKVL